jgi:hypothetical protein
MSLASRIKAIHRALTAEEPQRHADQQHAVPRNPVELPLQPARQPNPNGRWRNQAIALKSSQSVVS